MTRVEPGTVFADKYVVESSLGGGSMGVVFSATHKELRQRVAIKLLKDSAPADSGERMIREARTTLSLSNEHVVRVMDVGRHEGRVFLVMEQLEGEDLASRLKERGKFEITEAVDYVLQACAGTADAHVHGIVHRDLKPGNLFLTRRPDGSPLVKVLDFGISKSTAGDDAEGSLTAPAQILGSPMYMSPEQACGSKSVDLRTDIWSLGVILFRFLTGKAPFGSGEIRAVLGRVLSEEPTPLRSLLPAAPAGLESIVGRCLAKAPNDRYPSIAELATDLAPFGTVDGRAAVARLVLEPAKRTHVRPAVARRPWLLVGAAALVVITVPALALGVLRAQRRASNEAANALSALPSTGSTTASASANAPEAATPSVASAALASTAPSPSSSPAPATGRRGPRPVARPPAPKGSPRTAATDDRY